MVGYDPAALADVVVRTLTERGWDVSLSADGGTRSLSFSRAVEDADVRMGLECSVLRPELPGSWVVAIRQAADGLDVDGLVEEAVEHGMPRTGALSACYRAWNDHTWTLDDVVSAALAAACHSIDEARSPEHGAQASAERRVVFDDYDFIDLDQFRDSVVDGDQGYEDPGEVPDSVASEQMMFERAVALDDEFRNVDIALDGRPVVAVGSLGLWDSRPSVGFTAKDFKDAYGKIMGRDCEMFRAWDENGRLLCEGIHHDGTNLFELRALDDDALDYLTDLDEGGPTYGDLLLLSLDAYSERPRVAEKVYGCKAVAWERPAKPLQGALRSPADLGAEARAAARLTTLADEGATRRAISR